MKRLVSDYGGGFSSLVLGQFSFRRRALFDPFHNHSAGVFNLNLFSGASGNFYFSSNGALKSTQIWWWINPTPFSLSDGFAYFNSIDQFQVSGYPGNWRGEGFNAIGRGSCTEKILEFYVPAWVAAH